MVLQIDKQNLKPTKTLFIGLTQFYGLGKTTGKKIQAFLGLSIFFKPYMLESFDSFKNVNTRKKKGNIVTFNVFKSLINNKINEPINDK